MFMRRPTDNSDAMNCPMVEASVTKVHVRRNVGASSRLAYKKNNVSVKT